MDRLAKDLAHIVKDGIDSEALFGRVCKYLADLVEYRATNLTPGEVEDLQVKVKQMRAGELSNEPLTKGELQRMDGEPAWCKEDEVWGIISVESSGHWALIPFFCEHKDGVSFTLDIEKRHLTLYRRQPKEAQG